MLCYRLTKILPVIVHQNQGAFIKNRLLAHNILILQDLLHGYTRKNVSPRCLIKIDLSKAYDSLDWIFLEDILKDFCFPSKFIQWIMACLTGTSYTLLMNGRLQGSFDGRKGLRRGDNTSPLLFVLVMEYLTHLLSLVSQHKDFWFHPMRKSLHLVNLCFVDDLILFCKVFFGGISAEVKKSILSVVSIENGIRSYWMSIFLLPHSVIQDIDRLHRNFLWGAQGNRNKFHCTSWDQVCLPKSMGGIGFKEGSKRNKVLLAKFIWAISSKQDVLWVKWIDELYLKGHTFWDYSLKLDVSWYWRKLCYLKELFSEADLEALLVHGKLNLKFLYSSMLKRDSISFAKGVWCRLSVPKHRFILWQSVLSHLLSRDNLLRCHIYIASSSCPVCERDEESHMHLFFDCVFSQRVLELIKI
ncbi:uncharacterized protein LOC133806013 [Humulus lupulus]|uniref:uncharacterized protein LOC133806013 n=1 Tax=Humulus lupulus TaxID=3486 RepID=UPI002B40EC23|nr:uncharacterized protein LOC133806013 [Humulus lupulus]